MCGIVLETPTFDCGLLFFAAMRDGLPESGTVQMDLLATVAVQGVFHHCGRFQHTILHRSQFQQGIRFF